MNQFENTAKMILFPLIKRPLDNWSAATACGSQYNLLVEAQKNQYKYFANLICKRHCVKTAAEAGSKFTSKYAQVIFLLHEVRAR